MSKEKQVLHFIKKRFKTDSNWTTGNCYYFAMILCERFRDMKIYYDPIDGHFFVGADGEYYDWTGRIEAPPQMMSLDDLRREDPLWFSHLMRDCRD